MLFLMRKNAKKKNNTDDLAEMIDNPPDGMPTMKWRSLVDKWKREEWQKKSDIASKNRK
ncbi:putative transposase-like protein [Cocos nucifera]|uniref:Putative transposase-like protein n=1 Tax=Cocos nucifera TaxID=13894 RepID=A0A8K0I6W8_COCNU|nr:putative transposase-like protein [Cocos nucifera]